MQQNRETGNNLSTTSPIATVHYQAKRLAGKNISELTYFVSSGMLSLDSIFKSQVKEPLINKVTSAPLTQIMKKKKHNTMRRKNTRRKKHNRMRRNDS